MTIKEYNADFYPKYSSAYCALRNIPHAVEKCSNPKEVQHQLNCIGLNDEVIQFLCNALEVCNDNIKATLRFNSTELRR